MINTMKNYVQLRQGIGASGANGLQEAIPSKPEHIPTDVMCKASVIMGEPSSMYILLE
jgi:hypothetical protein